MSQNPLSNLRISLKRLLLMAVIFIGCQEDEPTNPCINGTLMDATGLDGCSWLIEIADGTRLEPTNLQDFDVRLEDKLPVCIQYEELENMASICMIGPVVEITSLIEGTRID